MKIFVINLQKNKERLSTIDQQLRNIGVEYERVEAVYGKDLSLEEKRSSLNEFAWWCLMGYPARDGEVGCALSHLKIYKKMIDEDISWACVLEDDANPHDNLLDILHFIENSNEIKSGDKSVILISDKSGSDKNSYQIRPISSAFFSDGYVITKTAAQSIYSHNYPIKCPADTWTFWRRRRWINLYHATPCGCGQQWTEEGYVSDVTPDSTDAVNIRRYSFMKKCLWKLKRLVGKIFTEILYR